MSKVAKLDRQSGRIVVAGAMAKLKAYAEELGLSVDQKGSWKYGTSGDHLELTVKFVTGGEEGKTELEQNEFARYANYFGIEASDYGAIITVRGTKYRLNKLNLRRGVKYPFECESTNGGRGIRLPHEYKDIIIAQRKKAA
jgi:hypothetical protein